MVWGGRREEGSGWGTRVYLWRIHVDIWQNQYNIVKLKNKIYKNFFFLKVKLLSRLLATPWTAANQVPLSMGFARQEYWSPTFLLT